MGSIEPTDFWSLYIMNPWIFWQHTSGIEYYYHYIDSSLVLNPWIEIPNASPATALLRYEILAQTIPIHAVRTYAGAS